MGEIVRVHHLDCCTMCPVVGVGGAIPAHVLALETERSGIVLVDTGIGEEARRQPGPWLGRPFTTLFRPDRDPSTTARAQLAALGFGPDDVRHIVVTHLDVDHAGALADFPDATVHVHATELQAATERATAAERSRYRPIQWRHRPRFAAYQEVGEPWFGFDAVHALDGLPEEVLAVPLPGHTRGHAAIAVDGPDGWLLHCGDAYFDEHTVRPSVPVGPRVIRGFEQLVAIDRPRVADNHARLRELEADHGHEVTVFAAHVAAELDRLRPLPPTAS